MPRHADDGVSGRELATAQQQSRWLCLSAGCAMMLCAGSVYSFGSVAEDLKANLQLRDAHQQGLISICGNLGLWIGSFTGGILADAKGPTVAMLGSAGLYFVGYGAMYLALSHRVQALREPMVVAFFYLLAGLASGWAMNSAMFTNTQNWLPARRAKVVVRNFYHLIPPTCAAGLRSPSSLSVASNNSSLLARESSPLQPPTC
jgi:MFS family permease